MTNPSMERRHFEFIAECIKTLRYNVSTEHCDVDNIARWFAGRLSMTNGQFNKARFLEACGVVDKEQLNPYK